MGLLVVINAPYGFSSIWSVVKPWLSKETQEKVHIFGSDYAPFLLELVDADVLPQAFGGKCTCPSGCQLSNLGPWMEGRKERRERWIRGEIANPGLNLEDKLKEEEKNRLSRTVAVASRVSSSSHSVGINED